MENKFNTILVIFGKVGNGKTYYTINECIPAFDKRNIFIIDKNKEYKEAIDNDKYNVYNVCIHKENENVIKTIDIIDYDNSIFNINNVEIKQNIKQNIFCIIDCINKEEFNYVCYLIYNNIPNCLFICDEIDTFINPKEIQKEFDLLLHQGRHKLIDIIAISRRPYAVNRLLTSQAHRLVVYPMSELRDIKYIEDITGLEYSNQDYEVITTFEKAGRFGKDRIIYKPKIYDL